MRRASLEHMQDAKTMQAVAVGCGPSTLVMRCESQRRGGKCGRDVEGACLERGRWGGI